MFLRDHNKSSVYSDTKSAHIENTKPAQKRSDYFKTFTD